MTKPNERFYTKKESIKKLLSKIYSSKEFEIIRVKEGEANEVNIVKFNDQKVILKIRHNDWQDYPQEIFYKDMVRENGIPVPKTLHHGVFDFKNPNFPNQQFEIQEFIDLPTAHDYNNSQIYSDTKFRDKILGELGEILKKMHSIPFEKFGTIREKVYTESFETYKSNSLKNLIFRPDSEEVLKELKINQKELNTLILEKFLEIQNPKPSFIHWDLEPAHLFVENDKIVGIIDFGNYRVSSYHEEFAWWSFWQSSLPLEPILSKYNLHSSNFYQEVLPFKVEISLNLATYFKKDNRREPYQKSINTLLNCIQKMKN